MPSSESAEIAVVIDWTRPGRTACQEQTMHTVAALARLDHSVTVHMARGRADPALGPEDLCSHYGLTGSFAVRQHRFDGAGAKIWQNIRWLRFFFRSGALGNADLVYSRVPMMLVMGAECPRQFLFDHYRRWPEQFPILRPFIRRTLASDRCIGMSVHSQFAAQSFAPLAREPEQILIAHNGYDATRYAAPLSVDDARRQLGLPRDRAIILYAGRTNRRKGLDQLLYVADRCPRRLFLIVGHEGQPWIISEAAKRANVTLVGWQDPDALPQFMYAADLLIVPPSLEPLQRFGTAVLPLKIFQYLAAGRPIIAPVSADTEELLEHGRNAWLVPASQPGMTATAIERLLNDRNLSERLSNEARNSAAALSWDARGRKLSTFIKRRLAASTAAGRA